MPTQRRRDSGGMPGTSTPGVHAVLGERARVLRAHGSGDAGRHVVRQPHRQPGRHDIPHQVPG